MCMQSFCISVYVYKNECMHVFVYVHLCARTCVFVCVCVCARARVHAWLDTHRGTQKDSHIKTCNLHIHIHTYINTYIQGCLGGRMVSVAD